MADITQPEPETVKQPLSSGDVENVAEESLTNPPVKQLILSEKQRAILLQKLGKQLIYYFSSQNLATDTYLTTIMKINKGYVPLTIVSNFAKVMRMITSHTNYVQLGENDICGLIREAVLQQSDLLNLVLLNQEGHVISKYGDVNYDPTAQNLTLEAVGPNGSIGEQHVRTSRSDSVVQESSRATPEPTTESKNIVILREVPEDATDDDILNIFKNADDSSTPSPIVSRLQREHGNCWFVTIESNKNDMVSILLDLRNKKICNEPVKARLKTVSVASSSVPMQAPGYVPYRKIQVPARNYNNNNQIYTGDRPHYSKKGNGKGQFNGFKHGARGGRGSGGLHSSSGAAQKGNGGNGRKVNEEKAVPPPPLVEAHFPTLGDSPKASSDSGLKDSKVEDRVEKDGDKAAAAAGIVFPPLLNTSGYAAALKKAAPPDASQFNTRPAHSSIKSPARKNVAKVESVANSSSSSKNNTVATDDLSVDAKSSLSSKPESEKSGPSDLSGKVVVSAGAASSGGSSWGGGRSFAEIVKKQEPGEVVAK